MSASQPTIQKPDSISKNPFHALSPAAAKLFLILLFHMDRNKNRGIVSLPVRNLAALSGFSKRWCLQLLCELENHGFLVSLQRKHHQARQRRLTFPPLLPQAQVNPTSPQLKPVPNQVNHTSPLNALSQPHPTDTIAPTHAFS